ncbi:MAG: gliding motility-associated C-terminal domain-containing protein [Bacteroidia bacterium]
MKKQTFKLIVFLIVLTAVNVCRAQYYIVDVVTLPETCSGGKVTIHRSGGTEPVFYNWSDNYHGSERDGVLAGNYSVTIMDAAGKDTSIAFTVKKERCPISISLAFSPNGDDINDVLTIGNVGLYPDFMFQVFNRWGQKVHEQSGGKFIAWDGKQFGVNVPDESYYWIFYFDSAIKDDIQTGSVSIIR